MDHPVVIIGGGVAGLGCAQTLQAAEIPFKLITKELGGRIIESTSQAVNYGAYYVTADYQHILPLITRGRRISILNFEFHHPGEAYSLLGLRAIRYLPQLLRLRQHLHIFRKHLRQFRQDALDEEQSVLLQRNPYLWKLVNQTATDFVHQHHLTELFRDYIAEALYSTDFISLSEGQAFEMLWLTQPLITATYEYRFDAAVVTQLFQRSIILDEVTALSPTTHGYSISTARHGTETVRHVVLAVPTPVMQTLLHTTEGKGPVTTYMYHLQGTVRPAYAKSRYQVFDDNNLLVIIAAQSDGSYLVYTKAPRNDFSELFLDYQIITKRVWDPAFNVIGPALTKQNRGNNLYVAGEHNICTLEDSYISGVYAARQIIKTLKRSV